MHIDKTGATVQWLRFFMIALLGLTGITRADGVLFTPDEQPSLASFIYIEPFEVRHELLVRVRDFEQWMPLALRHPDRIEADELEPLKQRIGTFLLQQNPLSIDGRPARPVLDRSHYVQVTQQGIQTLESPQQLALEQASVGIVLTYFTQNLPEALQLQWTLFDTYHSPVPVSALDPMTEFVSYVTPDDSLFSWPNFPEDLSLIRAQAMPPLEPVKTGTPGGSLHLPILSLLCWLGTALLLIFNLKKKRRHNRPGLLPRLLALSLLALGWGLKPYFRLETGLMTATRPELNPAQTKELLSHLLKNVYRAFEFRDEVAIYDKLALTVSGDLLETLYLQNRQAFSVQQAGGSQAKIRAIEVLGIQSFEPQPPGTYALQAQWSALGSVGHWGHVHRRKNVYDARITLRPESGMWRISALDLLSEKRVQLDQAVK